jgi:NADH-quinone oxidoreductase subunit L
LDNAWLIPALPMLGAILIGLFGTRLLKGASHWPAILGVGGAVLLSLVLYRAVHEVPHEQYEHTQIVYEWFPTGAPDVLQTATHDESWFAVSFRIDPLTAIMLVTVTVVSLLVVIYSRDYMRHHGHPERGYERFFAFLALFVFSMTSLVLAGNFLLLYLGWELVGLCSYLLIGFYYQKPSAAAAAKKAFLVNRIGDFGFGLGVLLIYLTFHTLDYTAVLSATTAAMNGATDQLQGILGLADTAAATRVMLVIQQRAGLIALLLFCGAVGKSAQLPLYVWLPDAMEGPSPVSALIHAATMVTAGVYMVARCGALFVADFRVMIVVAVIGGLTALFAATIALAQYDMKRILAYSTISQLGYMFLGLGVYAADSAIFHLFTHAFFKALLFLGAGSVMHAMGGIIDVRSFGGLRKILPVTFVTFTIGSLALAGFPLLAGFWSKDEIIHAALAQQPVLGYMALTTAVLTAFYTFRMVFLAFFGHEKIPAGVHARESGGWMLLPLSLLSVGAVFAGYAGVTAFGGGGFLGLFEPHGRFHEFLHPVFAPFSAAVEQMQHGSRLGGSEAAHDYTLMYVSAGLAVLGIAVAYFAYVAMPSVPQAVRDAWPRAYRLLNSKYYVDEIYDALIARPLRRLGDLCFGTDNYFVDGLIWVVTAVPQLAGHVARTMQRGAMQTYGLGMVTGLVIIVILVLTRG